MGFDRGNTTQVEPCGARLSEWRASHGKPGKQTESPASPGLHQPSHIKPMVNGSSCMESLALVMIAVQPLTNPLLLHPKSLLSTSQNQVRSRLKTAATDAVEAVVYHRICEPLGLRMSQRKEAPEEILVGWNWDWIKLKRSDLLCWALMYWYGAGEKLVEQVERFSSGDVFKTSYIGKIENQESNLQLSKPPETPVLQSFVWSEAGSRHWSGGKSGSGKSTILPNERFYDVDGGVDQRGDRGGHQVNSISGSLKNGYDTNVVKEGFQLSGGAKSQKNCHCHRANNQEPPYCSWTKPTSALDCESRANSAEALGRDN
nr:putative ABC transporter B family member 8 [Ipomoea batatas]